MSFNCTIVMFNNHARHQFQWSAFRSIFVFFSTISWRISHSPNANKQLKEVCELSLLGLLCDFVIFT